MYVDIVDSNENPERLNDAILKSLNFFTKMDYKNLSVCFTPAFFHIFGMKHDKTSNAKRPKRTFNSQKSEKDLEDTVVSRI